jgi:hypothetical protein
MSGTVFKVDVVQMDSETMAVSVEDEDERFAEFFGRPELPELIEKLFEAWTDNEKFETPNVEDEGFVGNRKMTELITRLLDIQDRRAEEKK